MTKLKVDPDQSNINHRGKLKPSTFIPVTRFIKDAVRFGL